MTYVKTNNGSVVEYPYQIGKIRQENPQTSFPSEIPDSLLAEYGVYPVTPVAPPTVTIYERAVEGTPALVNGAWRQTWTIVAALPPDSITPRQCRLLLLQQGLLDDVEAMIAAQDEATRITWEYALEFRRDDPLLNALAANLGLTDEQIDEFFFAASEL
jgi:hypothetical protein